MSVSYLYHICTIFIPYLYHIYTRFVPYLHHIYTIFVPYCTIFTPYLHHICTIITPYLYHICTIFINSGNTINSQLPALLIGALFLKIGNTDLVCKSHPLFYFQVICTFRRNASTYARLPDDILYSWGFQLCYCYYTSITLLWKWSHTNFKWFLPKNTPSTIITLLWKWSHTNSKWFVPQNRGAVLKAYTLLEL